MENKLTILAVDDDFINLKLIHSMLKKNQHVEKVLEASNGLEALTLLGENSEIDVVLLDIKMPIMNGIEFLTNMQSQANLKNIPVIVLTTDETKKHEAFDHGAYDFLVKPIREPELNQKLEKIAELLI